MSILTAVKAVGTLGIFFASAPSLAAQAPAPQGKTWELRFSTGGLVATGKQRNSIKDANLMTAQLSWLVRPALAITGTFGWARSRDLGSVNSPKLDVFTSDLGIEARPAQWFATRAVTFSPFVGLGAGGRSYNYRSLDVDATHNLAGYATVGGEVGFRRVGLRLEVRDYVTGFKPLIGPGRPEARNDVVIMVGLRFNRHASSPR